MLFNDTLKNRNALYKLRNDTNMIKPTEYDYSFNNMILRDTHELYPMYITELISCIFTHIRCSARQLIYKASDSTDTNSRYTIIFYEYCIIIITCPA